MKYHNTAKGLRLLYFGLLIPFIAAVLFYSAAAAALITTAGSEGVYINEAADKVNFPDLSVLNTIISIGGWAACAAGCALAAKDSEKFRASALLYGMIAFMPIIDMVDADIQDAVYTFLTVSKVIVGLIAVYFVIKCTGDMCLQANGKGMGSFGKITWIVCVISCAADVLQIVVDFAAKHFNVHIESSLVAMTMFYVISLPLILIRFVSAIMYMIYIFNARRAIMNISE